MIKKKGKAISFDAMVKFFMLNYNIPTKSDIDKLMAKMEHIEKLIKASAVSGKTKRISGTKTGKSSQNDSPTASDMVLEIIKMFQDGAGFAEIQAGTGFGDKKLRNIIFRLNKTGRIKRKRRGVYIAS